jgi:hypothetical protein
MLSESEVISVRARGPIEFIERDERLVFNHGSKGLALTLPSSWSRLNNMSPEREPKERRLVNAVWSPKSMGYILYILPEVAKKWMKGRTATIDMMHIKKLMKEGSQTTSITGLGDLIRLSIAASMVAGFDWIILRYGRDDKPFAESLEFYLHRMASVNEHVLKNRIIETECYGDVKVLIKKDRNEKEYCENDFITLTENLFKLHNELFDKVLECVEKVKEGIDDNSYDDSYNDAVRHESSLDFNWFYSLRQLVKCINAGVFSGLQYSGIHVVWLSILFKMIERNADCLMRILHMIDYLQRRLKGKVVSGGEGSKEPVKEFLENLAKDLHKVKNRCEQLKEITMLSIEGGEPSKKKGLSEEDRRIIAAIIEEYNYELAPKVGEISEIYSTEIVQKSSDLEQGFFGTYINSIKGLAEKYKGEGYDIIFLQLLSELRMVAKFPRNIAVGALLLQAEQWENVEKK